MNPTTASAGTRTLGFLTVTTSRGPAHSVAHAAGDAAPAPHLVLVVQTKGDARLVEEADTAPCRPGDVFVRDRADAFELLEGADHEVHFVRIPRRALSLTDHQLHVLIRRPPVPGSAVAALLSPVLTELPQASPHTAAGLAVGVAELVSLLVVEHGPATGTGPNAPAPAADPSIGDPAGRGAGPEREDLVRRLCAYVDAHLWDRDLSPAKVAAAQHISIRYLHKLFESHGSTVGRWIQHRRLEEARRELARPGRHDLTVSAVARRWGFTSATHFSRSFRTRYGVSPSDWRDTPQLMSPEAYQDVV